MRQQTNPVLVQTIAYRLAGAKPWSKQCSDIANWTPRNKLQWNFNRIHISSLIQIHLKLSYAKMAAILSRPQCTADGFIYVTYTWPLSQYTSEIYIFLKDWIIWISHISELMKTPWYMSDLKDNHELDLSYTCVAKLTEYGFEVINDVDDLNTK